ncbi:hypothetical protein JKF63_04275 [Porcisia hertigi]|uniref:Uncharacterized protein n=1 Tax=Porcisia hertigi TaxID=2761500 RepID=A0A836HZD5_9TRYP|nr:hypothetical protein JKF63_04275 [Porcisia hertigi]
MESYAHDSIHSSGSTPNLDDAALLRKLIKSAKSAHSTLGRALDTNLSHQRFGGAEMEPSALTISWRERKRQVRLQSEMQDLCDEVHLRATRTQKQLRDGIPLAASATVTARCATATPTPPETNTVVNNTADTSQLFIPALPTMAPSMTAAADDGTEALGGTKIGGDDRGYVTLISAVPTYNTTRLIEDNYELISSFRAYRTDALKTEQQTALRDVSAPHPDLLQQLAPLVHQEQGVEGAQQHLLVDQETLPYHLRQRYARGRASQLMPVAQTDVPAGAAGEGEKAAEHNPESPPLADGSKSMATASRGTWPFTCQGRPDIMGAQYSGRADEAGGKSSTAPSCRRRIGHRKPCIGQYHMRYTVVEPRVLGGYVEPQAPVRHREPKDTASTCRNLSVEEFTTHTQCIATDDAPSLSQTQRTDRNTCTLHSSDAVAATRRCGSTHGQNTKGSSMFISESPRQMKHGTAAPDVFYWPYPDVRSTSARVHCFVQLDHPVTQRRRELLVSGVPASVYNVCGDISANQPRTVVMEQTTGRDTHWYGPKATCSPCEPLDVDGALRATRPKEKAATLPPGTHGSGAKTDPACAQSVVDTSVSIERNLAYPQSSIGDPAQLAHIRDFGKVLTREQWEAQATRNTGRSAGNGVLAEYAEEASEWTQRRSPSAVIHPSAPGHQLLHSPNATELGNIPSLVLTKPRSGCMTDLGKGKPRPTHLLPLHDLTYNAEPGYILTGPRVKGTPSIGRSVTRQQVRTRAAKEGCGAPVMYNPTNYLNPHPKSVPDFEKQITKEYEFRGHRVQSERYRRLFPSAPGPGHYTVNYSQVE